MSVERSEREQEEVFFKVLAAKTQVTGENFPLHCGGEKAAAAAAAKNQILNAVYIFYTSQKAERKRKTC